MEDPRRCSTLSFSFILCFSLWLTPAETSTSMNYFTSKYDVQCSDRCEKRGYDYYWCQSQEGWDYCSPGEKLDYKGKTCLNACGKYGGSFYVCYLGGTSWSQCGRVEPRAMIHYTRYRKECVDRCQYHESGDYFWCHDGNDSDGWEYCSPRQDHTDKNVPCRSNHQCDNYGYSYTWCYTTSNNDWDYCGVIRPGNCVFSQTSRAKQQSNNQIVICTREENNNRRVTTFREGESTRFAETDRKLRSEALGLISRWDNHVLSDLPRSNLITSSNLRLDNQGLCNWNHQRYYTLQIQRDGPHAPGRSTTVAQIIVSVDTSAEYVRLAFRESLQRQVGVVVEVDETLPIINLNVKSCNQREN